MILLLLIIGPRPIDIINLVVNILPLIILLRHIK